MKRDVEKKKFTDLRQEDKTTVNVDERKKKKRSGESKNDAVRGLAHNRGGRGV